MSLKLLLHDLPAEKPEMRKSQSTSIYFSCLSRLQGCGLQRFSAYLLARSILRREERDLRDMPTEVQRELVFETKVIG